MQLLIAFLLFIAGAVTATLIISLCVVENLESIEKLLFSLPAVLIAALALAFNIHLQFKIAEANRRNELKGYDLKSYDEYVAEPIKEAIKTLEVLHDKIEKLGSNPSGDITLKKKLTDIINSDVLCACNQAFRFCKESDNYVIGCKRSSTFSEIFRSAPDEKKIDDALLEILDEPFNSANFKLSLSRIAQKIEKLIVDKKVALRSHISKCSHDVVKDHDKSLFKKTN